VSPNSREVGGAPLAPASDAARRRAAVETYAHHEAALRRTARRYSLCADDAEDALQRGLEILLRKAPSTDPRELIRWTQTVVKHEALAVRRERERILSGPAASRPKPGGEDWVALIPSESDGPPEQAERREAVARSREALQALKPQELRALTLLAEGYSYVEIGEITGYSATKINRCLAEGRARFRHLVGHSEDGRRCAELGPTISSYCDGEVGAAEAAAMREHLRACAHCRSTLRAYRAAPAAAAALAPALPLDRSLLDRAHDGIADLAARLGFGGASSDSALTQWAAAGGGRGAGMAALAKALAVCAGTVGGAAACVATGVVPAPLAIGVDHAPPPAIERQYRPAVASPAEPEVEAESGSEAPSDDSGAAPESAPDPAPQTLPPEPEVESGAVEYSPPPPVEEAPIPASSPASDAGDPAGEFGP
jgi:RNA polymerase sigma factor (sigma-70 family)